MLPLQVLLQLLRLDLYRSVGRYRTARQFMVADLPQRCVVAGWRNHGLQLSQVVVRGQVQNPHCLREALVLLVRQSQRGWIDGLPEAEMIVFPYKGRIVR